MRNPPSRDELPGLIGAQHDMSKRIENIKIFYDAIADRDEELARRQKTIDRRDGEIERLRRQIAGLERDLRSRPRSPNQLRAIVTTSANRAKVIEETWTEIQELAEKLQTLAERLAAAPDEPAQS